MLPSQCVSSSGPLKIMKKAYGDFPNLLTLRTISTMLNIPQASLAERNQSSTSVRSCAAAPVIGPFAYPFAGSITARAKLSSSCNEDRSR